MTYSCWPWPHCLAKGDKETKPSFFFWKLTNDKVDEHLISAFYFIVIQVNNGVRLEAEVEED